MLSNLFHRHQRLAREEEEEEEVTLPHDEDVDNTILASVNSPTPAASRSSTSLSEEADVERQQGPRRQRRSSRTAPAASTTTASAFSASSTEAAAASQQATTTTTTDEEAGGEGMSTAADDSMPALVSRRHRDENNEFSDDEEDTDEEDLVLPRDTAATATNDAAAATTTTTTFTTTQHLTLAELEEERELARRRSSACVMFSVFVLFRLWIEAIQQGDFGLLMLSLVGTSWTARWIRHNRDREEELDRRIARYLEQQEQQENGTTGTVAAGTGLDRGDLRMLSFQAQLALAIMESQRQMMQGGYGNPDGNNSSVGVSDSAKGRWEQFSFKTQPPVVGSASTKKAGYGSLSQKDEDNNKLLKSTHHVHEDEEEPHCSICLCEYESGETLTKLPCHHIYHDECISSWCSSHVKCPLCNFDLETAPPDDGGTNSIV